MTRKGVVFRYLVFATCALVQPVVAQDAPPAVRPGAPLTVEEAVRLGLEHNGRVRGADSDAAAARAAEREARGALLPAVRTVATYTRIGGDMPGADITLPGLDTTFTLLPIERDRYHIEVSVEQPLFTGGRLSGSVTAAAREAAAAERLAEQERADVAFEIRQAYWMLYGARNGLAAMDASLARVGAHLDEVRQRFDEGAALRSEVLAAQTRRSEIALDRVELLNATRVWQLELNRLTGLPLTTEIVLAAAIEPEALAADTEALAADAVAARPQLQALAQQVGALRAQLSAAQGGRLPDVAFVSRYIYGRPNPYAFTDQSSFRGTWEAGLSLQWSVWEGGAQSARVAQVREKLGAAEARLDVAQRQAAVDAARQVLETQRAMEAVIVAAANVEQAAESLRVTRQQYREGAVLSSHVLEAEQAYQQAQARQARVLAEHAITRAALLHAQGVVW